MKKYVLKDCPACGSEAEIRSIEGLIYEGKTWRIGCKSCDFQICDYAQLEEHGIDTLSTAVDSWNYRPEIEKIIAVLADKLDANKDKSNG